MAVVGFTNLAPTAANSAYYETEVEGAALASQGKHTPFLGFELPGQVRATVVGGRIAYRR